MTGGPARAAFGLAFALTGCGGVDDAVEAPERLAAFDCRFEDVTATAGIDFVHRNGARGAKLLPETMGSGACLFDADGDGALDLFLVSSGALPEGGPSALYRGRGDGTFEDVSARSGADVACYGMGAAAADFDADGDQDLYVTALLEDVLLVNAGGARFRDGTAAAGLVDPGWTDAEGRWHPSWSTAAAFLDADLDGDVDLFVGGYCRWTEELEIFTTLDGVHKAFTTPDHYVGLPPRLYANRGDGTFERVRDPELDGAVGKTLGVASWDLDGDLQPEIAVANDTRPNFLFRLDAGGRWSEAAERFGIAYDENGRARAGMGIDLADLAGDGEVALAIGNFAGEPASFYRLAKGAFEPRAARAGLALPTLPRLAFGLAFLDADLDGRLDLAVANGHIEPDVERYHPDERHAQPAQLFRGLDGGRFAEVDAGADLARPRVGRGLAFGDVDGDGDLDLVITQNGGPAVLLANRAQEIRPRHWLRVRLRGAGANPDALGAVVTLTAGGRVQRRTVRTGSSYLSQSELHPTFGLGHTVEVERLEVRWPDGAVTRHAVAAVDREILVERGP